MTLLSRRLVACLSVVALIFAAPTLAAPETDPPDEETQDEVPEQDVDDEVEPDDDQEVGDQETEAPEGEAPGDEEPGTTVVDETPSIDGPFNPGNFDITVHGGATSWGTWLWIEPGAELGIMELADGIVLAGGANLNMGWCGLCTILGGLPGIDRIRGWYVSPSVRPTVHFNVLADAIDLPQLDVYAGGILGPSFYSLSIVTDNNIGVGADAETNVFSIIGGPLFGARFTLSGDAGFFIAAEMRILGEFGTTTTSLQITDGEDEELVEDQARGLRRGAAVTDTNIGIGFRF